MLYIVTIVLFRVYTACSICCTEIKTVIYRCLTFYCYIALYFSALSIIMVEVLLRWAWLRKGV